jgi:monoterpene epsilon-lactone hydrolase
MSEGRRNGDLGAAASIAGEAPMRALPIPTTVSPQMQKLIGAPANPIWKAHPKTEQEWKTLVEASTAAAIGRLPSMCERLRVKFERTAIEGVRCHVVAPDAIAPQNRDRLLLHFHGGCYVLGPGEAGLPEAVLMAGLGGFQVISVDYRMPP